MSEGAKFFFVAIALIGLLFAGGVLIGANQSDSGSFDKWEGKLNKWSGGIFSSPIDTNDIVLKTSACTLDSTAATPSLRMPKATKCELTIKKSDKRVRSLKLTLRQGHQVIAAFEPNKGDDPRPLEADVKLKPGEKSRETSVAVPREGGTLNLDCRLTAGNICTVTLN